MKSVTPYITTTSSDETDIGQLMKGTFDLTRTDEGALALGASIEACADPYDSALQIAYPYVLWRNEDGSVTKQNFYTPLTAKVEEIAKNTTLALTMVSIFSSSPFSLRLHHDLGSVREREEETHEGETTVGRCTLFITDGDLLIGWNGEDDLSVQIFDADEVEEEDVASVEDISSHICLTLPKRQSNHALLKNYEKAKALVNLANDRMRYSYPFKITVSQSDFQ
jgi:hypothetical protein